MESILSHSEAYSRKIVAVLLRREGGISYG